MIYFRISELMLPTLIQRFDKNHFSFDLLIEFKNKRLTEILQGVRCHIYDRINTIYQCIQHFFDKKMSICEEYGAFK